jgi:hypothetical protein
MPAVSTHYTSCVMPFLYNKLALLCRQFLQNLFTLTQLIPTTNFPSIPTTNFSIPLRSATDNKHVTLHSKTWPTVQRSDAGRRNTAYCAVPWARQLYRMTSRDSHGIQGHDKRDTVYADNRWPQLLDVHATWQKVTDCKTLQLHRPTTHT